MQLEHRERQQWVSEIAHLNERLNEQMERRGHL